MRRLALIRTLCFTVLVGMSYPAVADVRARLQLQQAWSHTDADSLQRVLGFRDPVVSAGELRLMADISRGAWQLNVHEQVYLQDGSAVDLDRALREQGVPDPVYTLGRSNLLNLNQRWHDVGRRRSGQHLDRLWIGYNGRRLVARVGRQALTWGGGQVFHPMDLIDPFAPTATDTEYKAGADMLYAQWLFANGSDLQAVLLPRRDPATRSLQRAQGAAALYGHWAGATLQGNALLAHDHGDTVVGLNLNGPAGGATWSVEVVPTLAAGGHLAVSMDANISNAFSLWQHSANAFAEYYRNGFGLARTRYTLNSLPADLLIRLDHGQVFNTGIDYLALGGEFDVTPLWQAAPTLLYNLRDRSAFALFKLTGSLADNVDLITGLQLPFGRQGTEFRGVETAAGSGVYLEAQRKIYLQLNCYF